MESKANYTAVGIFVLVLSAILLLIFVWLAAGLNRHPRVTYVAYMNESVSGLNIDAPVKYNGVDVGNVRSISLNLKNMRQVRLLLQINQEIPITEATTATLTSQGLTGVSYIDLKSHRANAPLLELTPGEEYPVIKTEPSLFSRLDVTVRELSVSLRNLSNKISTVFDDENQRSMKNLLVNLDKISATFGKNTEKLDTIISQAAITFKNTAKGSQELPGSIQLFSTQLMPQIAQTLTQLQNITNELQRNPSVLIRGRQPLPLGPGE